MMGRSRSREDQSPKSEQLNRRTVVSLGWDGQCRGSWVRVRKVSTRVATLEWSSRWRAIIRGRNYLYGGEDFCVSGVGDG